jgi:hypothetical protein
MNRVASKRFAHSWWVIILALLASKCIFIEAKKDYIEIDGGSFEYDGPLNANAFGMNGGGDFSDNGPILDYNSNGPFGGNAASFDGPAEFIEEIVEMPFAANALAGRRSNRFDREERNFDRFDRRGPGFEVITELTWLPFPPFPTSTSTQTVNPWWPPTTTNYNGTTFVYSTSTHYNHGKWNCYTTEYRNTEPRNYDYDWREYDDGYFIYPGGRSGQNDYNDDGEYYPYSPPMPTNIIQDQKVNINISNGGSSKRIFTEEIYRGNNGIVTTMLFETAMPGDILGQGASANQAPLTSNFFPPPGSPPPTRPIAQSGPSATRPVVITQYANSTAQQLPFGQGASAPLVLNPPVVIGNPNFSSFPAASPPPQRPTASSLSSFVAPIASGITSGVTNSVFGATPFNNILRSNGQAPPAQQFAGTPPAQAPAQPPARAPVLLSNPPAAATTAVTRTATPRPTRTLDISDSDLFDSDYISLSDAGVSIRASLKTIFVGAGIGIIFLAVF